MVEREAAFKVLECKTYIVGRVRQTQGEDAITVCHRNTHTERDGRKLGANVAQGRRKVFLHEPLDLLWRGPDRGPKPDLKVRRWRFGRALQPAIVARRPDPLKVCRPGPHEGIPHRGAHLAGRGRCRGQLERKWDRGRHATPRPRPQARRPI